MVYNTRHRHMGIYCGGARILKMLMWLSCKMVQRRCATLSTLKFNDSELYSKGHMKLKLITFIRLSICVCVCVLCTYVPIYYCTYSSILAHLRGWYKMSLCYIVCMLPGDDDTATYKKVTLCTIYTPYSSIVFYKHIEHITKL